jgi:hypothetical protein
MERSGLVDSIIQGVAYIAEGRRGLQTDGKEHEGRLSFEKGHGRSSAKAGLAKFDDAVRPNGRALILPLGKRLLPYDAFLVLKAVEEGAAYHTVDMAFPHERVYRYKGMPRDSFHLACISDKTRIRNGLSRLGLPNLDLDLAQRRIDALASVQDIYFDKQTAACDKTNEQ